MIEQDLAAELKILVLDAIKEHPRKERQLGQLFAMDDKRLADLLASSIWDLSLALDAAIALEVDIETYFSKSL